MPRLVTVSGKLFDLVPGCSYVLGRDERCDVVIEDCSCSRRHARIVVRGAEGEAYLEDCGSRNGTFLNGRKVAESVPVPEGAQIVVGATVLIFLYGDPGEQGTETREMYSPEAFLLEAPPELVGPLGPDMPSDTGIRGSLASMTVVEVLQMLHQTRRSGTLEIDTAAGTGRIEIRSGEVLAASQAGHSGVDALHRIAAWREGTFRFAGNAAACDREIRASTQRLLLDLCRVLDEATSQVTLARGAEPGPTAGSDLD